MFKFFVHLKMKIAFYKHTGKIEDKLIRWWTRPALASIFSCAKYSHTEIVFSTGEFFSSSGRDGGTRFKEIEIKPARWDFVDIPVNADQEKQVLEFCKSQIGKKYDWRAIFFSQFLKLKREDPGKWFCSEICLRAIQELGFFPGEIPSEFSPQKLFDLLESKDFSVEIG